MATENDPSYNAEQLYAKREPIHPKAIRGRFRRFKDIVLLVAYGVFFLLPWVRWDRGGTGPDQAVMFDIPGRRYYLFDLVIHPQDMFLLAGFLILAAWLLFFVTGLVGRAFCGYFCFQTLWTDVFMKVEALVQGDRNKRMRLEKQPWNGEKIAKKGLTVAIWTLIAFWTGFTFTSYWADAPQLFVNFLTLDAASAAYITTGILTATTLIFAGFAREQVCIYMCPYARFQSVMFDKETLVVSYDAKRGEGEAGRQPLKQGLMTLEERHAQGVGDCIDCKLCVQVCPTGIDIRDGLQLECISCGLCIDACDQIMTKRGWPTGLIRYASEQELETGEKPNLFKFRTIGYGLATLAATALLLYGIFARAPADMSVQQVRQPLFTVMSDGQIQNNYNVKINNKLQEDLAFDLELKGMDNAVVSIVGDFDTLAIPADGSRKYLVHVRAPREAGVERKDIEFVLSEQDDKLEPLVHSATFVFQ
ncbi:cytochrome c oxidase accessory protein CcoG [Guyparkeria sp.]|uniref:cytochrome c oxidase accessory protein CcoG n=1 Tax=Guyparkeria sp. TaxID=2035736 RepID=UPI00356443AD